jgi:hypothetical protein
MFVSALNLKGQHRKDLQKQNSSSDTISVRFSMCGTIQGDTVLFNDPLKNDGLHRYFTRNLRYPFEDSIVTISCKLYFIIDKEGRITGALCGAGTATALDKEVTRVARKMPFVRPSYVKGKPVVTRVETRIAFVEDDENIISKWDNYETDILIIYSKMHRRRHSGAGTMLRKE